MTVLGVIAWGLAIINCLVIFIFVVQLLKVLFTMQPAQGVVVDNIAEESGENTVWAPVVEFTDHHGQVYEGVMNYHQAPAKEIGTQVDLRFNPDDPTQISQSAGRLMVGLAISCAVLVPWLVIIAVVRS